MSKILEIEDVATVGGMMGSQSIMSMGGSSNNATIYVLLKEEKEATSQKIAEQINAMFVDTPYSVSASGSTMDMSALGGSGISLQIRPNNNRRYVIDQEAIRMDCPCIPTWLPTLSAILDSSRRYYILSSTNSKSYLLSMYNL